jgi:hypothetical protein
MPFYSDTDSLYGSLRAVFTHIEKDSPQAYKGLTRSRLALRIRCTAPAAEVLLDGRQPGKVKASYGGAAGRPDLDVELAADTLHHILLDTLSMRKAMGGGLIKVRGPAWKLSALIDVIKAGRLVYPDVLRKQKLLKK